MDENRRNSAITALADDPVRIEECAPPEPKVDDSESDESTCEYDLVVAAQRYQRGAAGRDGADDSEASADATHSDSDDSDCSDPETNVRQMYVLNPSSSVEELLDAADSGTDSPLTVDARPVSRPGSPPGRPGPVPGPGSEPGVHDKLSEADTGSDTGRSAEAAPAQHATSDQPAGSAEADALQPKTAEATTAEAPAAGSSAEAEADAKAGDSVETKDVEAEPSVKTDDESLADHRTEDDENSTVTQRAVVLDTGQKEAVTPADTGQGTEMKSVVGGQCDTDSVEEDLSVTTESVEVTTSAAAAPTSAVSADVIVGVGETPSVSHRTLPETVETSETGVVTSSVCAFPKDGEVPREKTAAASDSQEPTKVTSSDATGANDSAVSKTAPAGHVASGEAETSARVEATSASDVNVLNAATFSDSAKLVADCDSVRAAKCADSSDVCANESSGDSSANGESDACAAKSALSRAASPPVCANNASDSRTKELTETAAGGAEDSTAASRPPPIVTLTPAPDGVRDALTAPSSAGQLQGRAETPAGDVTEPLGAQVTADTAGQDRCPQPAAGERPAAANERPTGERAQHEPCSPDSATEQVPTEQGVVQERGQPHTAETGTNGGDGSVAATVADELKDEEVSLKSEVVISETVPKTINAEGGEIAPAHASEVALSGIDSDQTSPTRTPEHVTQGQGAPAPSPAPETAVRSTSPTLGTSPAPPALVTTPVPVRDAPSGPECAAPGPAGAQEKLVSDDPTAVKVAVDGGGALVRPECRSPEEKPAADGPVPADSCRVVTASDVTTAATEAGPGDGTGVGPLRDTAQIEAGRAVGGAEPDSGSGAEPALGRKAEHEEKEAESAASDGAETAPMAGAGAETGSVAAPETKTEAVQDNETTPESAKIDTEPAPESHTAVDVCSTSSPNASHQSVNDTKADHSASVDSETDRTTDRTIETEPAIASKSAPDAAAATDNAVDSVHAAHSPVGTMVTGAEETGKGPSDVAGHPRSTDDLAVEDAPRQTEGDASEDLAADVMPPDVASGGGGVTAAEALETDVVPADMEATQVQAADITPSDASENDVPKADVPGSSDSAADVPSGDVTSVAKADIPTANVDKTDVPSPYVEVTNVSSSNDPARDSTQLELASDKLAVDGPAANVADEKTTASDLINSAATDLKGTAAGGNETSHETELSNEQQAAGVAKENDSNPDKTFDIATNESHSDTENSSVTEGRSLPVSGEGSGNSPVPEHVSVVGNATAHPSGAERPLSAAPNETSEPAEMAHSSPPAPAAEHEPVPAEGASPAAASDHRLAGSAPVLTGQTDVADPTVTAAPGAKCDAASVDEPGPSAAEVSAGGATSTADGATSTPAPAGAEEQTAIAGPRPEGGDPAAGGEPPAAALPTESVTSAGPGSEPALETAPAPPSVSDRPPSDSGGPGESRQSGGETPAAGPDRQPAEGATAADTAPKHAGKARKSKKRRKKDAAKKSAISASVENIAVAAVTSETAEPAVQTTKPAKGKASIAKEKPVEQSSKQTKPDEQKAKKTASTAAPSAKSKQSKRKTTAPARGTKCGDDNAVDETSASKESSTSSTAERTKSASEENSSKQNRSEGPEEPPSSTQQSSTASKDTAVTALPTAECIAKSLLEEGPPHTALPVSEDPTEPPISASEGTPDIASTELKGSEDPARGPVSHIPPSNETPTVGIESGGALSRGGLEFALPESSEPKGPLSPEPVIERLETAGAGIDSSEQLTAPSPSETGNLETVNLSETTDTTEPKMTDLVESGVSGSPDEIAQNTVSRDGQAESKTAKAEPIEITTPDEDEILTETKLSGASGTDVEFTGSCENQWQPETKTPVETERPANTAIAETNEKQNEIIIPRETGLLVEKDTSIESGQAAEIMKPCVDGDGVASASVSEQTSPTEEIKLPSETNVLEAAEVSAEIDPSKEANEVIERKAVDVKAPDDVCEKEDELGESTNSETTKNIADKDVPENHMLDVEADAAQQVEALGEVGESVEAETTNKDSKLIESTTTDENAPAPDVSTSGKDSKPADTFPAADENASTERNVTAEVRDSEDSIAPVDKTKGLIEGKTSTEDKSIEGSECPEESQPSKDENVPKEDDESETTNVTDEPSASNETKVLDESNVSDEIKVSEDPKILQGISGSEESEASKETKISEDSNESVDTAVLEETRKSEASAVSVEEKEGDKTSVSAEDIESGNADAPVKCDIPDEKDAMPKNEPSVENKTAAETGNSEEDGVKAEATVSVENYSSVDIRKGEDTKVGTTGKDEESSDDADPATSVDEPETSGDALKADTIQETEDSTEPASCVDAISVDVTEASDGTDAPDDSKVSEDKESQVVNKLQTEADKCEDAKLILESNACSDDETPIETISPEESEETVGNVESEKSDHAEEMKEEATVLPCDEAQEAVETRMSVDSETPDVLDKTESAVPECTVEAACKGNLPEKVDVPAEADSIETSGNESEKESTKDDDVRNTEELVEAKKAVEIEPSTNHDDSTECKDNDKTEHLIETDGSAASQTPVPATSSEGEPSEEVVSKELTEAVEAITSTETKETAELSSTPEKPTSEITAADTTDSLALDSMLSEDKTAVETKASETDTAGENLAPPQIMPVVECDTSVSGTHEEVISVEAKAAVESTAPLESEAPLETTARAETKTPVETATQSELESLNKTETVSETDALDGEICSEEAPVDVTVTEEANKSTNSASLPETEMPAKASVGEETEGPVENKPPAGTETSVESTVTEETETPVETVSDAEVEPAADIVETMETVNPSETTVTEETETLVETVTTPASEAPVEIMETMETAKPSETVEAETPVETVKPAETVEMVDAETPVETVENETPSEITIPPTYAMPVETAVSVETETPVETAAAAQPKPSGETKATSETKKPVETVLPSAAEISVETTIPLKTETPVDPIISAVTETTPEALTPSDNGTTVETVTTAETEAASETTHSVGTETPIEAVKVTENTVSIETMERLEAQTPAKSTAPTEPETSVEKLSAVVESVQPAIEAESEKPIENPSVPTESKTSEEIAVTTETNTTDTSVETTVQVEAEAPVQNTVDQKTETPIKASLPEESTVQTEPATAEPDPKPEAETSQPATAGATAPTAITSASEIEAPCSLSMEAETPDKVTSPEEIPETIVSSTDIDALIESRPPIEHKMTDDTFVSEAAIVDENNATTVTEMSTEDGSSETETSFISTVSSETEDSIKTTISVEANEEQSPVAESQLPAEGTIGEGSPEDSTMTTKAVVPTETDAPSAIQTETTVPEHSSLSPVKTVSLDRTVPELVATEQTKTVSDTDELAPAQQVPTELGPTDVTAASGDVSDVCAPVDSTDTPPVDSTDTPPAGSADTPSVDTAETAARSGGRDPPPADSVPEPTAAGASGPPAPSEPMVTQTGPEQTPAASGQGPGAPESLDRGPQVGKNPHNGVAGAAAAPGGITPDSAEQTRPGEGGAAGAGGAACRGDRPEGASAAPGRAASPRAAAATPAGDSPGVNPQPDSAGEPIVADSRPEDGVEPARTAAARDATEASTGGGAAGGAGGGGGRPAAEADAAARGFVSVVAVGAAGSTVVHTAGAAPVTVTTAADGERPAAASVASVEVTDAAGDGGGGTEPPPPPREQEVDLVAPSSEEVEVVTDEKTNSVLVASGAGDDADRLCEAVESAVQTRDEVIHMKVGSGAPPESTSRLADYFAGLETPVPAGERRSRTPEVRHRSSPETAASVDAKDDFDDGFDFGGGEGEEYPSIGYDHFDSDERYSVEEHESLSDASQEEQYTEEDLRGFGQPLDFTLSTILEESCEESDMDEKEARAAAAAENVASADPSELEKYFFFELGAGELEPPRIGNEESECSTEFLGTESDMSLSMSSQFSEITTDTDSTEVDPVEKAAARYQGHGNPLFRNESLRSVDSEVQTDGSGSVGSDSEGQPSPEQRRKKVPRARFRAQSGDLVGSGGEASGREISDKSDGTSSDEDLPQDPSDETAFEKSDGQFDTIKRRKKKKAPSAAAIAAAAAAAVKDRDTVSEKTRTASGELPTHPRLQTVAVAADATSGGVARDSILPQLEKTGEARQSRDSGFLGSSDDLLKESPAAREGTEIHQETAASRPVPDSSDEEALQSSSTTVSQRSTSGEEGATGGRRSATPKAGPSRDRLTASPAAGSPGRSPASKTRNKVIRKDSFNNWSSDEETNILMGRLRQFFRANILTPRPAAPSATPAAKPVQLLSFENELTRMMKSVPGINEAQVREIVEYLSSEDTWSDSYDSSDYTSSDFEGAYGTFNPGQPDFISQIQQQFSHQMTHKYSPAPPPPPTVPSVGAKANPADAVAMYDQMLGSLRGLSQEAAPPPPQPPQPPVPASPPMLAKVMQHVGDRLVALMHEVSSGGDSTSLSDHSPNLSARLPRSRDFFSESPYTSSPKVRRPTAVAAAVSNPDLTPGHSPGAPRSSYHLLKTAPPAASDDNILASLETASSPTGPRKSVGSAGSTGSIDFNRILRDSKRKKKKEFDSCHNLVEGRSEKDVEEGEPTLGRAEDKWTRLSGRVKSEGDVSVKSCGTGSTLTIGRPRSSEFSSSEQVDSDSTLRAADSYEKHLGQRTTPRWFSSRSSLGSKNSLNTSLSSETITARPEASDSEPEDKKSRRFLFNYKRRSSVPDTSAAEPGEAERSTTLPRSTTVSGSTDALPAQSSLSLPRSRVTSPHKAVHLGVSSLAADSVRSARYRAPGYRQVGPTSRRALLGARRSSWSHKADERQAGTPGRPGESPLAAHSSSTLDRRSMSSLPTSEPDDDIDRLVALHQQRSATLSTLGSRSDSMASVYSAGEARYGTVPVRGDLQLALQYNYQQSALEVTVKQCRDLAAVDTKRNRSDPYVKAYLLPDRSKSGKRKTKTKKHTLNPIFDETLKFPAVEAELESRTLWVTVWHSDMFGRNDFLGELVLPICRTLFDDPSPHWYTLQERSEIQEESPGHRGDVIVAFKYTPPDGSLGRKGRKTKGRLHITIKEAKNLAPVRANGSADPFCKCYLLPDRKNSKQKTPVAKRTTCPRWSGTLTYENVSLGELRERALELTIWDHSLTSNEFLGGARFNLGSGKQLGKPVDWMDAAGQERALWEQLIERPGYWVEGSVPLRFSMERAVTADK